MQRRWRPPSGGLLFLGGSWVLLCAFLVWGFAQPSLERVWMVIQHMREPHAKGLGGADLALLRSTMRRHPGLAVALAGKDRLGWVETLDTEWCTLPRSHYVLHGESDARRVFWVDSRAHERAYPMVISLRGEGFFQDLRFLADGRQSFELAPGQLDEPLVVEVSVVAAIPSGPGARPFQFSISSEAPVGEWRSP